MPRQLPAGTPGASMRRCLAPVCCRSEALIPVRSDQDPCPWAGSHECCCLVWLPKPAWWVRSELPCCHLELLLPCETVPLPFWTGCALWYAVIHCMAPFTLPEVRSACTWLTSTPVCPSFVTNDWMRPDCLVLLNAC